ncbi:ubiquitin-like-conjugating enzyme ATG10 [Cylas formicarius]|uniref:ubiquitin-like-conjugating enzyme ATG10 n=1 Tax=Cylas formicarius TaxID=197179 RepID=UPI00295890F4|nr:ubiquitin-like-conjugating enzyme ATG10 [Cylas formicarius]XP_060529975.1 ubiquitin-like-conjugating enzyme ATG10 [Cylas formicarius]XP_060529976.1 ubiquitin-like-conjugating enzyme ATG10 [Cylas formicarius]XP_060529978.1 ubiquitin-like-conjugating enzyme ATG10 [Cylas formicarius]XP_060529979.1 ubiquitin-like-conjugating enzyme ATG10 [Cylas formicarius]XP_060529980.1 ubiquitin-like-conjugating enzyme ATG10 [Cylas formicarius]XP_060529981.1 ubiquitin-like-conjugating enzyme ATG10 [Cylas for
MEFAFSFDDFCRCLDEIVKISDSLLDGWKLEIRQEPENGQYMVKKITTFLAREEGDITSKKIATFEYHIVYHVNYGVPVLCFNVWNQDGTFITLEEYWAHSVDLKDDNMYETLTQMDHPVLRRPFLTLHPCRTREIMLPFLSKSKNPVISWLSVVGPFVHLKLHDEYLKCC